MNRRLEEFAEIGSSGPRRIFSELCFCILTAGFRADRCIEIQNRLGDRFMDAGLPDLEAGLKSLGHRFYRVRAGYIVEARKIAPRLPEIIRLPEPRARTWLVSNVKGLGMKEASHFLRNTGRLGVAVIDRHILRILGSLGLPCGSYTEAEESVFLIAGKLGMAPGELDLYLWYLETGKVLK